MLSLAQQLERVPVGYSFTKEAVISEKPKLHNPKQLEDAITAYCLAMTGKGPMTSTQIAVAVNRTRTSVNQTLRECLVPRGYVKKIGNIKEKGRGTPTYIYEWVDEED